MPPATSLVEGMFATGMISSVTGTTLREQTNPAIAIRSPLVLTGWAPDLMPGRAEPDSSWLSGSEVSRGSDTRPHPSADGCVGLSATMALLPCTCRRLAHGRKVRCRALVICGSSFEGLDPKEVAPAGATDQTLDSDYVLSGCRSRVDEFSVERPDDSVVPLSSSWAMSSMVDPG